MRPLPKTIKGRLFLWIFLFMTAFLIIRGIAVYREMKEAVFLSVKHSLHSKVQKLKGLIYEENGIVELQRDAIISGEYDIPRSGYYFKVVADEKIIAVSPSLVEENFRLVSGEPEKRDEQLNERIYLSKGPDREPLMVLQHDFEIVGVPVKIYAAQNLEEDLARIKEFRNFFLVSIPLSLLIVASVGLWIARRSLKPLTTLSLKIEKVSHNTLSERIETECEVEEIKVLAVAFNSLLDRLQKTFDTEKRLIADASHELKTPLAVIKTHCDVLLQRDRTKDEYKKGLNAIKNTSDSLNSLTDDLLSMARLDSGMLSASGFKKINVRECIEKAVKLTEVLAKGKNVIIKTVFTDDIVIRGEINMLIEAFLNIIENAVKYNNEEGSVNISVAKDDTHAKITIYDDGIGIKARDLERIFDRFYRADSSRSTKGTGLGLSIAKAIIDAHGGEITAQSGFGKGSCFTVTLPADSAAKIQ